MDFTAQFILSDPKIINGGAVMGQFYYDFDNARIKLEYTFKNVTEIIQYTSPEPLSLKLSSDTLTLNQDYSLDVILNQDSINYSIPKSCPLNSLLVGIPSCINSETIEITSSCLDYIEYTEIYGYPNQCQSDRMNYTRYINITFNSLALCEGSNVRVRVPGANMIWGQSYATLDGALDCVMFDAPVFSCYTSSTIRSTSNGCEKEFKFENMPLIYKQKDYKYVGTSIINQKQCYEYIKPENNTGVVNQLWLESDDKTPCRVVFTNGMDFEFNIVDLTEITVNVENTGDMCGCMKSIDVVLAFQKSSNTTFADFDNVRDISQNIMQHFQYSQHNTWSSIVIYSENDIQTVINFNEGFSDNNVRNGLLSLNCDMDFHGNRQDKCFSDVTDNPIIVLNNVTDLFNGSRSYSNKVLVLILENLSDIDLNSIRNTNSQLQYTVYIVVLDDGDKISTKNLVLLTENMWSRVVFIDDIVHYRFIEPWSNLICASNDSPCANCCGFCRSGYCQSPDICLQPTSSNCSNIAKILPDGICCSDSQACITDCPTSQCLPSGCYSNSCTKSQCIGTLPNTDMCHNTICDFQLNLTKQVPKSCGDHPCLNYTCFNGNCYGTILQSLQSRNNNCYYHTCLNNGTLILEKKTCPDIPCFIGTCNNLTGNCEYFPKPCSDPTNLCDKSYCDSNTGLCVNFSKTCPDFKNGDQCWPLDSCDTITGECTYKPKLCLPEGCETMQCNGTNGLCEAVTPSTCLGSCANYSCENISSICAIYSCNSSATEPNCDILFDDSYCVNGANQCRIYMGCDLLSGCIYNDIDCSNYPPLPCYVYQKNPNYFNCCEPIPLNCSTDPCYNQSCDLTTGKCISQPLCSSPSDSCTEVTCQFGKCFTTNITCVSPDPCYVVDYCDPSQGCIFIPKCSNNDSCNLSNCIEGQCFTYPLCDDGIACTTDYCDNGKCSYIQTCDDGIECTEDYCNGTNGECAYSKNHGLCDDGNLCTTDYCTVEGCKHDKINCSSSESNCKQVECQPSLGCVVLPKTCTFDDPNPQTTDPYPCPINYCENGECKQRNLQCHHALVDARPE